MWLIVIDKLQVRTASANYPIYIGTGLLDDMGAYLRDLPDFSVCPDVFLISNDTVFPLYGEKVEKQLSSLGKRVFKFILPDGEKYKTWAMTEQVLTYALSKNLSRKTLLLALGGGVVGDLAGFAAAVYLRGIPFVQIPTTLLAQVDSSVGGKVAVNHVLGKNMIGSFYHPKMVLTDINTLNTLPEREWLAGLAEVIKYGIIWDGQFFQFLQEHKEPILARDQACVTKVISRCCEIKAEIVNIDEKEQGLRAVLNFGHTVGHAIERATNYKVYRHGEAVAIGMAVAVRLAVLMDVLLPQDGEMLIDALESWGFSIKMPSIPVQQVIEGLSYDKKTVGDNIIFILPRKIGKVDMVNLCDRELIEQAIALSH